MRPSPRLRPLLVVAALAIWGCDDDGPASSDATPVADAAQDAAVDAAPPAARTLREAPVLDGLPIENRVVAPWFNAGWSHGLARASATTTVQRLVIPDAPTPAPIARLGPHAQPGGLVFRAQMGSGVHTATVWIGTDADTPEALDAVSPAFATLAAATHLGPNPEARHRSEIPEPIVWARFEGLVEADGGPGLLSIDARPDAALYVHAPVVTLGGAVALARVAPRPSEARLRAAWRALGEAARPGGTP
ncbi:MAG: hypothetical protein KC613_05770 [Myxococcales bacterium]|nr:hypothetical protein [Myxococcales bacterium]